jgi:2'-5' RNA ligase
MKPVRAFIAVEIPVDIQQQIGSLISPLTRVAGSPVRWVRSGNIHLTLKFLGDCDPARLEKIGVSLREELEKTAPFEMEVGGFGAFPNLNRPRVFWCGLKRMSDLNDLYEKVESVCASAGCQRENRPFSPHLTLGRSSDRAAPRDLQNIAATVRSFPQHPLGLVRVDGLTIFQSQLNPGGSIYTPLIQIPLGDAGKVPGSGKHT